MSRATDPAQRRASNWSRHWASGASHSCEGSFRDNYEGAIASFWHERFDALPRGARVIDIATGNGAVPRLLAARLAHRTDWSCDAVDIASVAPSWWGSLPADRRSQLRFHSGVAAEDLSLFDSGQFNLVTSQYGIEYSALDVSLNEALRIVAPGGCLALVVHHKQSRPVRLAEAEAEHLEWLLAAQGLFAAAADMLDPLARSRSPAGLASLAGDATANARRDRFNDLQDALGARAARAPDGADVLFEARQAVQSAVAATLNQGLESGQRSLAVAVLAFEDHLWRLGDLARCALDEARLGDLVARSGTRAREVRTQPVVEGPHLMGWSILAELPIS